jgi:hypothetical protein
MAWIDDLADSLEVDRLETDEIDTLLETARDVAHQIERKVTPLSTFLLGIAVGRGARLQDVQAKVRGLIPDGD